MAHEHLARVQAEAGDERRPALPLGSGEEGLPAAWAARVASQARRAWSRVGMGAFQIAMIASPMYLSMVPPQFWIAAAITSKYLPRSRASSGGNRSARR